MKKLLLFTLHFIWCAIVFAQFTVRINVQHPTTTPDSIYIAGSFNKWNPGDKNFILSAFRDNNKFIALHLPAGHYEYKFTRGNWTSVESTEAGLDIYNRVAEIKSDTVLNDTIAGWLDKFTDISKLPDTTQLKVAYLRSFFYLEKNLDSSYHYAQLANWLMQKTRNESLEPDLLRILGRVLQRQGYHQQALEYFMKELKLVENEKDTIATAFCLLDIGNLFFGIKDYEKAKGYYLKVAKTRAYAFGHSAPNLALVRLGKIYYNTNMPDSALYYAQKAYTMSIDGIDRTSQSESATLLGDIREKEGNSEAAIKFYNQAVEQGLLFNSLAIAAENYQHIANAYYHNGNMDSAFYYARKAFAITQQLKNPFSIADASNLMATLFSSSHQSDSAYKYLQMVVTAKDSLFSQDKTRHLQAVIFDEQLHEQESIAQQEHLRTQVKIYALLAWLAGLILIASILFVNNRHKQKANSLLQFQKEKLQATLYELQAAQAQLVQSEKMASLGELTAGIAHEIQNPLNFVKNFSEVNKELLEEMTNDIEKNNFEHLKALASDVKDNQEKINFHANRADSIVRGMLQHSRKNAGQKEPTDINVLADEFMRLSYHGLRAKDKTFNANMQTNFDPTIGKINIIPQDIGRVLLNLFNNAFYAVDQKKKQLNRPYNPQVLVSTKKNNDKVEIRVRDNGTGIPQKALEKIFQPFYTTKPTGEGTGLGLSLSYDIITKVHGGELKVDTEEGAYSEFVIELPV